jgi:hypothetical protein
MLATEDRCVVEPERGNGSVMLVDANLQRHPPVFSMVCDFAIRLAPQCIVYECWSSTMVP